MPDVMHTIVAGDTLARIAARYGSTVQAIAEANNITNPNLIFVGRVLRIPGAGSTGAPNTGGRLTTEADLLNFFSSTSNVEGRPDAALLAAIAAQKKAEEKKRTEQWIVWGGLALLLVAIFGASGR